MRYTADAVTAVRLVATPLFIFCILRASSSMVAGWLACLLFAIAAWSDVADGRLARRRGTASASGRILDHFADIVFILGAFGTYVYVGIAPWWVPASIAVAFSFYVFDSWVRTASFKPSLVTSRIGHVGGVANWVLIGVLAFNDSAGLYLLPSGLVAVLFAFVPLYSAAAIIGRFVGQGSVVAKNVPGS
jgi:CDP-diacylglycerol--glycerol-3-phosphate 3-phosphatidyltransferase